jgi:outer membrane protein
MASFWVGGVTAAAAVIVNVVFDVSFHVAGAETLTSALVQAYQTNSQLNSQRAIVRQIDESVPQALSGYRPRISASAQAGEQFTLQQNRIGTTTVMSTGSTQPRGVNVVTQQTLFDGFQTANRTRAAESSVFAAREILRVIEQTVLLDAVTAYMNVLRDSAIIEVQRSNVHFLGLTLRQTRDRRKMGEVTLTDVFQAEAQLAAGRSMLLIAESNLTTSKAVYRRVIGSEAGRLAPGTPVDRLSPHTLAGAVAEGIAKNPSVASAMYGVDVAQLQVKIAEGALYPVVTLEGAVARSHDVQFGTPEQFTGSVGVRLNIPLYQGGAEYATIRQYKEALGQRRLDLATTRDQARATVVQAWGQQESAKAQVQVVQGQVRAAEMALSGVREEAQIGNRTTFDVLNAQQTVVNARVALVTVKRDLVVATYTLLSAVGRLSPQVLGLAIPVYDPMVHYQQVRDTWIGERTPDGR